MTSTTITPAQMTALETAGVFEAPEGDEAVLVAAISGNRLMLGEDGERIARIVCDLSNGADELSRELTDEPAAWARKDARVLANLYGTILHSAKHAA